MAEIFPMVDNGKSASDIAGYVLVRENQTEFELEDPEQVKFCGDDGVAESIVEVGGEGERCGGWVEDAVCGDEEGAETTGGFGGFSGEGEGS